MEGHQHLCLVLQNRYVPSHVAMHLLRTANNQHLRPKKQIRKNKKNNNIPGAIPEIILAIMPSKMLFSQQYSDVTRMSSVFKKTCRGSRGDNSIIEHIVI